MYLQFFSWQYLFHKKKQKKGGGSTVGFLCVWLFFF